MRKTAIHSFGLVAAILTFVMLASGCDQHRYSPVAPPAVSPVTQPAPALPGDPPVSPPAPAPTATLEIASFELNLAEVNKSAYFYLPKIVLKETSGVSAASLKRFLFTEGGFRFEFDDNTPLGTGCLLTTESRSVRAGGTWTESQVYYYCRFVDLPGDIAGLPVTLTVTYKDDQGVVGEVSSVAKVGPAPGSSPTFRVD